MVGQARLDLVMRSWERRCGVVWEMVVVWNLREESSCLVRKQEEGEMTRSGDFELATNYSGRNARSLPDDDYPFVLDCRFAV